MKVTYFAGLLATCAVFSTTAAPLNKRFVPARQSAGNAATSEWTPIKPRWSALQNKRDAFRNFAVTSDTDLPAEPTTAPKEEKPKGKGKTAGKEKSKKGKKVGKKAGKKASKKTGKKVAGEKEEPAAGGNKPQANPTPTSAMLVSASVNLTISADQASPTATCVLTSKPSLEELVQTQAFLPATAKDENGVTQMLVVHAPVMDVTGSIPQAKGTVALTSTSRAVLAKGEANAKEGLVKTDPKAALKSGEFIQAFYPAMQMNKDGNMETVTALSSSGFMVPAVDVNGTQLFAKVNDQVVQLFVPAANSTMVPGELNGTKGSAPPELESASVPALCQIDSKDAGSSSTKEDPTEEPTATKGFTEEGNEPQKSTETPKSSSTAPSPQRTHFSDNPDPANDFSSGIII